MKRKILVTGAGGFVGRALVLALKKRGEKVIQVHQEHFAKINTLRSLLNGVDTVYYLAGAKKNLRFHTARPYFFLEGNVRPLFTFLSLLKATKIRRVIYLSSTIVEHGEKSVELDGYVLGKQINELILQAFA